MLTPKASTSKLTFWNLTNQTWRDSNANIVGILNCAADATRADAAENLTELKNQELLTEKKLRELFVIALAHDLRSPLATARMSAEMLEMNCNNSKEVLRYAEMISRNIARADRMILDLLDANQIRAGEKLPLKIEQCELRQLVQEILLELNMVYGDRFQLIADHSIVGHWSKSELRRVIENLCSNAIKYGCKEAPVKVYLKTSDNNCIIEVQNQGSLISEKDQSQLFDHHRRTMSAKACGEKGWGLGLALVKGITEAHGGLVTVQSTEATGTVFRIEIPLDSRQEINSF